MKRLFLASLMSLLALRAVAQTDVPFDSSHWMITGKVVKESFHGEEWIRLTEGEMYLKDSTFKNGVIEFDMALTQDRYFPGFGFRVQDQENYESIYLRPHQMGNPDAIQYTPVYNGQAAWQLYHGEGYSTAVRYPMGEWVHVKLIVQDSQAEVYIDNPDKPALVIHQLKREPKPGKISISNGAPTVTRFANFRYTKQNNPPLIGKFQQEVSPQTGTILNWQVSTPFDEKRLQERYILPQEMTKSLTWHNMTAENSGLLNLARMSKLSESNNTVFTKITLISENPQIKKFQLGFSDRAKVYVNGKLVYAGQDIFGSRDYRFLGTIGYFDEIYLDLKKGKNELWIAVSETFGGWGLQGLIADQTGLTIEDTQQKTSHNHRIK